MGRKIGIDLGTSYSCVSFVDDDGIVRVIPNAEGEQTTPSAVCFAPDEQRVSVGALAKAEGVLYPECLVERVKNYMGDPDYSVYINGEEYSPTAVSCLILNKLIADAEAYLGEEIDGAVITCPAYFGHEARSATKVAAECVILSNGKHLTVWNVLDEPVATTLAYMNCVDEDEDMDKNLLIYDLGGGTFDCTLINIKASVDRKAFQIITTNGNHQLGGKDWDAALQKFVTDKFCMETGTDREDMECDWEIRAWLGERIEQVKKELSSMETTAFPISFARCKERITVTREEFEEVTSHLLDETIALVDQMLERKDMSFADVDEILLVGGSTYMPQVRKRLEAEYNKPIYLCQPDQMVAMGAAIYADGGKMGSLTGNRMGVSYGIRLYQNGQEWALNLLTKSDRRNRTRESSMYLPNIMLTGKEEEVNAVRILVVTNHSDYAIVPMEHCRRVYEEKVIVLDKPMRGNGRIKLTIADEWDKVGFIPGGNPITVTLTDEETQKSYSFTPIQYWWKEEEDANRIAVKKEAVVPLLKKDGQIYHKINKSIGVILLDEERQERSFFTLLNKRYFFAGDKAHSAEVELEIGEEGANIGIAVCDTEQTTAYEGFEEIGRMTVYAEPESSRVRLSCCVYDGGDTVKVKAKIGKTEQMMTIKGKLISMRECCYSEDAVYGDDWKTGWTLMRADD